MPSTASHCCAQAPTYANEEERLKLNLAQLGSSGSSLRAKTFAADGQRSFIDSFNFGPRSMHLNTEMGLMIESPALAQQISGSFDRYIPSRAFRLSLTPEDNIRGHSGIGNPPSEYESHCNLDRQPY